MPTPIRFRSRRAALARCFWLLVLWLALKPFVLALSRIGVSDRCSNAFCDFLDLLIQEVPTNDR